MKDIIARHEAESRKIERRQREIIGEKEIVDTELNKVSVQYDSAYLSSVIDAERRRASIQQQLLDLNKLDTLVRKISSLSDIAEACVVEEQRIRLQLKEARQKAEEDTLNLKRLKELLLDCLLRAKIPGFLSTDIVEMKSPNFLPEVTPAGAGDLAVTSFTNLGSGGKKTLFKCCFAVAIHRLSAEIGGMLPTLLIIDSPMKNISERENREQFEGFHEMLYELSESELKNTQFILIDKELSAPPQNFVPSFNVRHMTPDDPQHPPLIRYYRGK
ncbi:MAG: hypothetical protein EOP06_30240 [Proteobacteria bacterium]|nr:MAG: hypothetical protein EOP06_30240 [Pseudomonadota bacterium]